MFLSPFASDIVFIGRLLGDSGVASCSGQKLKYAPQTPIQLDAAAISLDLVMLQCKGNDML